MNRRGFLKSILALAAAPAICKAENLMKIYVPRQEIIRSSTPIYSGMDIGRGDWTVEAWVKAPIDPMRPVRFAGWRHIAQVHKDNFVQDYVDGHPQSPDTLVKEFCGFHITKNSDRIAIGQTPGRQEYFAGAMDDLRITAGVARDIAPVEAQTPVDTWTHFVLPRNSEDAKLLVSPTLDRESVLAKFGHSSIRFDGTRSLLLKA